MERQRGGPHAAVAAVSDPLISIVVPCHNEAENLRALYERVSSVLAGHRLEIILVDDGSRDRTWPLICQLHEDDARVTGARLSRNFGKEPALLAGLRMAQGDAVVTLDADLQHPPELIPSMLEQWRAGASIVATVRRAGEEVSWLKRQTSVLFYRIFSWLAGTKLTSGSNDFRLLSRQVVDELCRFDASEEFLRGLVPWLGFNVATVEFVTAPRHAGETKYTWHRMYLLAVSAVLSFSIAPLRLAIAVGLVASVTAFINLCYALFVYAVGRTTPGWPTLVSLIALFFGIQFILMGLLGEYVGRIHLAIKRRPAFIIADVAGIDAERGSSPPAQVRR